MEELHQAWRENRLCELETSLTAVGYVDVLRVPTAILEKYIFPKIPAPEKLFAQAAVRPLAQDSVLEWLVDERFINGTKAMLINLDACTRCDDCVRACASTHEGNPRFRRQGRTFEYWMVANACMHCADPVCMIGCPDRRNPPLRTGGHRSHQRRHLRRLQHLRELVSLRQHRHGGDS